MARTETKFIGTLTYSTANDGGLGDEVRTILIKARFRDDLRRAFFDLQEGFGNGTVAKDDLTGIVNLLKRWDFEVFVGSKEKI